MSVTIPTNDWNFLVSGAVGDIIYDNISNDTATYESGFTSDGTNGAASNINTARLRIGTGSLSFHSSFSFEMVVRLNSSQGIHQLFYAHSGSGSYGTGLYCGTSTSSKIRFFTVTNSILFISDQNGTYTGSTLSMDGSTFYHIVCVLDKANDSAYIYQDGTKVWEQTSLSLSESDFPITPSTYVGIGREQSLTDINVKRFRVWENHALSANEITTLYDNRNTNYFTFRTLRTQNPPIYDWDFRQASSTTITDSIGGLTATYNNLTSDDTNGARCLSASSSYIELGTLNIPATLSIEIYFQTQTQSSYGQIYFGYAPTTFSYGDSSVYPASTAGTTVDETLEFYSSSTNNRLHWRNYVNGVNKSGYKVDSQGSGQIHMVATYENGSHKVYLNGNLANQLSIDTHIAQDYRFLLNKSLDSDSFTDRDIYYFRVYDYILSADQISALSTNVSSVSPFTIANLRINYGDVYLAQTSNKTIEDYKNENISLHDVSFTAFPANKLKETYIQGPVDISGDLIVRSDNNVFYDISAANIGFTQRTVTTVTDSSYGVFASTTSSYTNTNIVDPNGVSNTTSRYGRSVDMTRDGNYIAAGVLNEGRAHVWKVDDMTVTHLGQLTNPIQNGRFGTVRITADGSKAVVCDHNSLSYPQFTYIWSNPGSTTGSWSELTSARSGAASYNFGWRVSMSPDGNVLIKGPSGTDNPISTFIWSTDQWVSSGDIAARASGSYLLDNALNADGTICVVGANKYNSNNGYIAAYKYSKATTETDGTWDRLGDYIDINETDGSTLLYWGEDVCINDAGDIVAAAALGDGTNVTYDLIKAYKYSTPGVLGGTWTQLGNNIQSSRSGGTSSAFQNMDMNSDGSIIAYGANQAGTNGGAVVVYQYSLDPQIAGGEWNQIAFIDRPTTSSNLINWNFGSSVRINGFGNKLHVGISPGGSTAGTPYTYLINIEHTVDYRTVTTTSTPKVVTNDLSLNNRFFVGGDASFNGNVTIQGDLSLGSTISLSSTIPNSTVNVGPTGANTFTNDVSLNANLAIHGKTTVKNDLYLNAYTDVSANPVLSDGTYLKNMKMDKLNHRYIMDISRSAPFSTLTSNTLPSEIWDSSSNSGICVSADGKYIRTVNSGDLSSNALSYYSEDYGSSFHEDEELSQKLSFCDISFNTPDDYNYYHGTVTQAGVTITDAPTFNNFLSSGGEQTQTFTVDGITYTCSLSQGTLGSAFDMWRAFQSSTSVSGNTCCTSRTNNYYQDSSSANYTNNTISYTDFNGNSATQNAQWMIVDINDGNNGYYQVTRVQANSVYVNNYITEWMIFGRNESGNTVQLSDAVTGGWGVLKTITITNQTLVNQIYIAGTKGRTHNSFVSFHNIEFDLIRPDVRGSTTTFKYGGDKIFMSYNGQHQLVPRGISNKLTYDDYLYVSNNFGKNWNLRKSSTLRTFNYTVTANGSSNYILNGETYTDEAQPAVNIGPNESVVFTIDTTTNGNHPFKIGTSSSGGEITDSRITSVTSGSNQVITFTPTTSGTFYYYCSAHSGMGNSIIVANSNMGLFSKGPWFWNTGAVSADGKHMYVSGSNGFWKSSDYGRVWNQTSADSSFNFMSISADGKLVYGVNERKVYGSTDYGNTFSTLYTDAYTSDSSYCGISTSGNGKYITLAELRGSNIYMSSDYGNSFDLTPCAVQPQVNGAIHNWDFRLATPSGNTVTDSIGGLTATYANSATSTVANGISLTGGTTDGAGHHVDLQDFEIGLNYSFEVYLKFGSSVDNFERVFDFGDGQQSNNIIICRDGTTSNLQFANFTGSTLDANISGVGTIVSGVLTHLVGVIGSDGYLKLYQDGTLLGTSTATAGTSTKTRTHHYIGRSTWSGRSDTDGNIYYLRVYNRALTQNDVTDLYINREASTPNINCGISHSGKIVLNSNYISYNYGNNFHYIPSLISNNLSNRDTFYSKANMEYILDPSNNALLQIPYKSAIFQDIYSVGSIKAGSTTYSSDYRLKENVQPLTDNETVNELHPVKYYNTNLKKNDYGLLAHELQEKYPFLVSGEKDGAENQSINYNGLISLLVHEVKNLKKEYQELVEMKNNA